MNPEFNTHVDGQSAGVVHENPLNNPDYNSRQGLNTFALPYQNLITPRYGEITPFCYMSAIGRDRISLNSSHELRSYTLSAPLMSSLRMFKSNFSVAKSVMMPNTYEYLYVNPKRGDDVPDDAYCWFDLSDFISKIKTFYNSWTDANKATSEYKVRALKLFLLLCCMYSKGSLLDYLGVTSSRVHSNNKFFDDFFETFVDNLGPSSNKTKFYITATWEIASNTNPVTTTLFGTSSDKRNNVRVLYEILEHPDAKVVIAEATAGNFMKFMDSFFIQLNNLISGTFIINIYKVIAYQMICAQYYTNDSVDDIYNADLWLQNMKSLQSKTIRTFSVNGVDIVYDVFSNYMLKTMYTILSAGNIDNCIYFFTNLFTFRRSLRYGDYFTGARTSPLAVGDVNVPVVGDNVSVIDINKNLHIQRFLNAVNRLGSDIISYARGIFGYTPKAVKPYPNFISTEVEYIGGDEIDNTAENQGEVNLNLRSASNRYMYDVDISDDCVILSLCSFEVHGCYPNTVERDNLHVDRYDDFVPELQHIGDQSVYRIELDASPYSFDKNFGYQTRYAEYKYKYNQAHGGFTYNLPNWAFIYDTTHYPVLCSDLLRSCPYDFDSYYKSLTYGSFAGYFHFQISFVNEIKANRPMQMYPNLV